MNILAVVITLVVAVVVYFLFFKKGIPNNSIIYIRSDGCLDCDKLDEDNFFQKLGGINVVTLSQTTETAKMLMEKVQVDSDGFAVVLVYKDKDNVVRFPGSYKSPDSLIDFYNKTVA